MKFNSLITIFTSLTLLFAACEPSTPQETPTPPSDEEVTDEEKEEEKEDIEEEEEIVHPELPDATYALEENLDVRVHPLQTNGLRNDYVSFYDVHIFRDFDQ